MYDVFDSAQALELNPKVLTLRPGTPCIKIRQELYFKPYKEDMSGVKGTYGNPVYSLLCLVIQKRFIHIKHCDCYLHCTCVMGHVQVTG